MEDLGLVSHSDTEINPTTGLVTSTKPGNLKGRDLYIEDPHRWLMEVMVPAMAKKGITSDVDIGRELSLIFGRTGGNLFLQMYRQREKIAKNMGIWDKSDNLDQTLGKVDNSPAGAEAALGASWKSFMVSLGRTIIPIVVPALKMLSSGLDELSLIASRNPFATRIVMEGLAALGIALVGLGGLAIVAAGFKALGLIFTLGGLAPGVIGGVASSLGMVATGMTGLAGALAPLAALVGSAGLVAGTAALVLSLKGDTPGDPNYDPSDPRQRERAHQRGERELARYNAKRSGVWYGNGAASEGAIDSTPPAGGFNYGVPQVTGTVVIDGRKLGDIISDYQAKRSAQAPGGVGTFDGRMSPTPPGTPGY
jgi:hypothetical protein